MVMEYVGVSALRYSLERAGGGVGCHADGFAWLCVDRGAESSVGYLARASLDRPDERIVEIAVPGIDRNFEIAAGQQPLDMAVGPV